MAELLRWLFSNKKLAFLDCWGSLARAAILLTRPEGPCSRPGSDFSFRQRGGEGSGKDNGEDVQFTCRHGLMELEVLFVLGLQSNFKAYF